MAHRFPLKEIARQAGLGTATVDRVINDRAHVSPQSKARVEQAIAELEGQESQLAAKGRRMFFDFVVEAPTRFSTKIKTATEATLSSVGPAVCRPRFLFQEIMSEAETCDALKRIAKRGSHGVCLKARDLPSIRACVEKLISAGIPVVTLVTDIQSAGRLAYVGLDNQSAGRTAAYLIAKNIGTQTGTVLATRSDENFLGEEERWTAFKTKLAQLSPMLELVTISGGRGVSHQTSRVLGQSIHLLTDVKAVYSMGGGNLTILNFLDENRIAPKVYVAHDLDCENLPLLQKQRLSFVLHHDLRADMRNVFAAFMQHHRLAPEGVGTALSSVQVVTPENIPL